MYVNYFTFIQQLISVQVSSQPLRSASLVGLMKTCSKFRNDQETEILMLGVRDSSTPQLYPMMRRKQTLGRHIACE